MTYTRIASRPARLLTYFTALTALVLTTGVRVSAEDLYDPLEPMNRKIFWFNDQLDLYVVSPVARAYRDNLPKPVRNGVKNFFQNLGTPVYVVSDILQLKFGQVLTHSERFLINTTVGVVGVMDIAGDWGIEHEQEDIGAALGYDGVGAGPYLVLPLLGPSNIRDAFGRGVEVFLNPLYYLSYTDLRDDVAIPLEITLTALDQVDARSRLLEATDWGRENSLDYYTFVQSSYNQHRQSIIYDGNPPDEEEFEDEPPADDDSDKVDK